MELIKNLRETRDQTLQFFDLDLSVLGLRYAPGKWDIRHLLCHLADAESVLYDRIRRVISKPKQVIWAFDQDAWATGLDYSQFPLEISKNLYGSVREGVIYLASQYYESLGGNTFVHSETGIRTLKDEFDKVALHNAHHLKQIREALGKA